MFRKFNETTTWEQLCWETDYGFPADVREAAEDAYAWGYNKHPRQLLRAYIASEMRQQDLKQAVDFLIRLLKDNGIDNFVYPFNYGYIGIHPHTLFHKIAKSHYDYGREQYEKTENFMKLCKNFGKWNKKRKFKGNTFKQSFGGQKELTEQDAVNALRHNFNEQYLSMYLNWLMERKNKVNPYIMPEDDENVGLRQWCD